MADSHYDTEGFTFDTGAHFITNRLATATGVNEQCRDVEHYGETVWVDGRSYDYPSGLLRVPRFVRAALRGAGHALTATRRVTAADQFRREYGTALADEIALPLVEAWSGVPATELSPAVADKIPSGIARDGRAHGRGPAHPPGGRDRVLPGSAAERQRLARLSRARDLDGVRAASPPTSPTRSGSAARSSASP